MQRIMLHENWQLRFTPEGEWMPAAVPGSVYQDLLNNGKMEDPYYRDNELKALSVMDNDFEYCSMFDVPEGIFQEEEIGLIFKGVDTVADIFLNEVFLGHVENMHRTWEFSVKRMLRRQKNILKVHLYSPTRYIAQAYEEDPLGGSEDAMRGFPKLRKAHCMFGWDWGPRLPDAGIWREVLLEGYTDAKIENVYVTQDHRRVQTGEERPGDVQVDVGCRIEILKKGRLICMTDRETEKYRCRIQLVQPDGGVLTADKADDVIRVEMPRLWWPNGFGEQPLYTVKVELFCGERCLDTWEKRIGLRTMSMCMEKDAYGEQFAHEVNGVKIFAMGADYIPEDCILGRMSRERTFQLLMQAKEAHFNCIRVWGGGHYPADFFWDACDELGLIVWQDFMFACAVYHLTDDFEENIRAEFVDNVKRIRNHASLGLWCGNNEMEMFMAEGRWPSHPKRVSDYVKMYEYILPKLVKKYDPETFYWPASPSSGGAFDVPNDENRGDVHYWDVWHGNKPITEYRKFFFRYVSEFGFQSFPSLKTCEAFTEPEDRNIFSYVMEKHQRNKTANGKIMNYMEQTFLYPGSFGLILYASQLLQAEAIRYGVEHFRRNRGRCMGTIIWQLNDCWPVASWSSIDYFGRWKALHYYAKRFFAPLMLSCAEEGILTQDTNPNAQPYEVKKSVQLCVANETQENKCVIVRWALRNNRAEILKAGEEMVTAGALSATWLERVSMEEAELYGDYVSYELWENTRQLSGGTVLFCAPKHYHFLNPCLRAEVEDDELVIFADAYARSVEILNEKEDLLLEDNYFDMNAGSRRIKILKGCPEQLRLRSVYDIR